ncbi:ATP-grasp domain-containing protein [Loigolactobacillus backii]|uniref:ATP-grasp domain-containing protein n=1 Tax=Loigolactobacillus backii TaxID=375175 RepID=UPI000C1CA458|nr:alpha-L-glutamate ligase [Loigolactobacillus backii]MDA5387228.1 alpha-L-glutamate ligase [Loigolactobacillus backii]MDA5389765.1 alpha-L-glutamate ligase [Loigolactobacillus backii]PIO83455.1 alpha-L-glutamate ligase [Loigolactobacillus backii]
MTAKQPKVYVLHENLEWTQHLVTWLERNAIPYELWDLATGVLDLTSTPPEGIFYNRISASAHTRNHRFTPEFGQQVIKWLEDNHRIVLNGSNAIDLEISKVRQYLALQQSNIKTPKTIAVLGKEKLVAAAQQLNIFPLITKHNRAGKGAGVHRFDSIAELERYVNSTDFEEPVDGITLLQQYIKPIDGRIRRSEFIGRKFLYTVAIDSSQGFELCPADECQLPNVSESKFKIIAPLAAQQQSAYEQFLTANRLDVAAVEWVEDANHQKYVYDVNTNTNYNDQAESKAQIFAHEHLALYLQQVLEQQYAVVAK